MVGKSCGIHVIEVKKCNILSKKKKLKFSINISLNSM